MIVAATALFARAGFSGVTTKSIASRANVSHGNIFRYFPTKRDLFIAAIDFELGKLSLQFEPLNRIATTINSRAALKVLFETIADILVNQTELARLLHFSILEYGPEIAFPLRRHLGPIVDLVQKHLQAGSCDSDICSLPPSIAVFSFIATIATLNVLKDVFPEIYGSQGPYETVDSAAASATKLWFRVLYPESTVDEFVNMRTT